MANRRRGLKRTIGSAICGAVALFATAGWAGDGETPAPDEILPEVDQLIGEGLNRLFDHLQGVLEDLPRYALPELTEDGDIIIRRLPRGRQGWPQDMQNPDELLEL